MATVTKYILSASLNGKQIPVNALTSGSATEIHTTPAGTSSTDELWIYASNPNSSSVSCSILWGGTVEPDDVTRTLINPFSGRILLADGKLLNNGLIVKAYGSIEGSIVIDGFVNRIVA